MANHENTANEEQIKHAKQRDVIDRRTELNDLRFAMGDARSCRVLLRFLRFCKVDESPLGGADRDVFVRLGRQNVGRFIKSEMLEADRKKYLEMELQHGEEFDE